MLSSSELIRTIGAALKKYNAKNIVIDPVMVSKSEYKLLKDEAIEELKKFVSLGEIVTPNIPEGEILADMEIKNEDDMVEASKRIQKLGAKMFL